VKDYKKLFDRFSLSFTARNDNENIPTNERIENFRNGKEDPGLIAECVQYGRYLLISSSREGSLAANLQGIWCNEYTPSWDSKYTININLQMNYWFADSGNLFECEGPLFDLIRRMDKNGETTARVMYGCHGSLAHHNCDLYADTAPQDHWTPATIWVLGNAWMCYHIWEHYRYSLDSAFLNDNFRIIENQIRFFLEYLVKNDKGEYIINPSVSPENSYIDESGRVSALCEGCAMDSELLDGLFTIYEESCRILGKKSLENVEETRREIAKVGIDEDGSILEWLTPKRETEPGHRHFSPVFGVYPGENINRWDTPELFEAAEKTIEKRISHGSGHEGWSCTWAMALLARLYRRDEIYPLLVSQIGHCMYDNLLNGRGMVPDKDIFQIDGNFGLTAAMIEMLVQSHHGKVVLLPALPEKLSSGSVAGLRLRGNMVLSMQWKDGHVTAGKIVADSDNAFTLVMNGHESRITIAKGDTFCLDKATD
jgi:alpha-L-fucosidase 2